MRKKISQREAVRNRRELKALRAFVRGIEGTYGTGPRSREVVRFVAEARYTDAMTYAAWGASDHVVFVARRESADRISVVAISTPEARDAE